ncbi:hypothetical protein C8R44DRAFT_747509 [Mycena epipterygia]|nr:hypothetical protein C8R44DRAFT_747509 [Mycena epipterygia]
MSMRVGQTMLSARMGANSGEGRNAGIQQVHVTGQKQYIQTTEFGNPWKLRTPRASSAAHHRGTLKKLTDVVAWLKARWIRMSVKQVTDQKSMPLSPRQRGNAHKVMILAQFGHGYYIRGTLKRLMDVLACLKDWWICFGHGYYILGTLKRLMGVLVWLKAWWICTRNPCHSCLAGEKMAAKVMILAQFDHGHYIRGTLKRLTDVVAWLKAWWIRFGHGYYIRGTLKRLTDVVAWLKDWWFCFDHGYYIRGTLKRLMGVLAWLKAWWIRVSVTQVTDQKSMPLLPRWGGNALILAQFDHGYYIRGTLKRLTDVVAWLKARWIRMSVKQVTDQKFIEEMPTKVMILAQFDHGSYIRETLKRLTDVVACLKAFWIHFDHGYYIRGTLKWLADVFAWLKAWWIRVFWLGSELGGSVWYIRETLKRLTDVVAWLKAWWICVSVKQVTDPKSMPLLPRWGGKVVILAQFGHGYYIRGTLKWPAGVLAWLRASWMKSLEYLP